MSLEHADPEKVPSLMRQSDDMLVATWRVTHGKECRTIHSDTHSWQHLHGPQLIRQALWNGWATHEDLPHLGSSDAASAADVPQFGLQPYERELGEIYACFRTVVSAAEQGWATTRVRQFVFMFHKPWIYPLLAVAGLPASVP